MNNLHEVYHYLLKFDEHEIKVVKPKWFEEDQIFYTKHTYENGLTIQLKWFTETETVEANFKHIKELFSLKNSGLILLKDFEILKRNEYVNTGGSEMKVTSNDKKIFIEWFLTRHHLRVKEGVRILNLLKSDFRLLEKTHFVEDLRNTPRGLILTANGASETPIQFYNHGTILKAPEEIYQQVLNNREEELFIRINFPGKLLSKEYPQVLEQNPYAKNEFPAYISKESEKFLNHCIKEFQIAQLVKAIDEALDKHDKEAFMKYTEELKKLKKKN